MTCRCHLGFSYQTSSGIPLARAIKIRLAVVVHVPRNDLVTTPQACGDRVRPELLSRRAVSAKRRKRISKGGEYHHASRHAEEAHTFRLARAHGGASKRSASAAGWFGKPVPCLSIAVILLRFVAALLPVAMLWISKLIVDRVVAAISTGTPVDETVWWLLGAEVALAVLGDALSRATSLCDSLLGDRFTNHVSLRMMAHATQLDLVSFEDPVFYDKMERARRQTTSRLGMLASLATMAQQAITLLSLSVGIVAFSPLAPAAADRRCDPARSWARRALRCWPTRCCIAGLPSAVNSTISACLGRATAARRK